MSTADLKRLIDERSDAERQWITAYLLDQMHATPELAQTAEELAQLAARRAEMQMGRARVTQAEAEARWDRLDAEKQ